MQRPRSGTRALACCEFRCLLPAKGFGYAIGGELGFRDLVGAATPLPGWATIGKLPPGETFPDRTGRCRVTAR